MSDSAPPEWLGAARERDDPDFRKRRAKLLAQLPQFLREEQAKGRADRFLPYLLIRSVLGDRGDRPLHQPNWESPDIWTAPGDPSAAPPVPPDHGGTAVAGQPTTLYAHVWNLGFAPLIGVAVEFYWCNPSLGISDSLAHFIGHARCDLSGRGMEGSHKLVKCPKPWIPTFVNDGHECLFARVSGIGDPIGGNPWSSWFNRHVGQRNIAVVPVGAQISGLLASLDATRPPGSRIQLIQVGPREGELARRVAAPHLRLARVDSHVLAEMGADNRPVVARLRRASPGMLAGVHPLAAGEIPEPPPLRRSNDLPIVDVGRLFAPMKIPSGQGPDRTPRTSERRDAKGQMASLVAAAVDLNRSAKLLPPPRKGEAQMLRIAAYLGEQLVGGYSIIVTGRG